VATEVIDDGTVPGVFPAVAPTGTSATGVPIIELPVVNGSATAVWEVVNTSPQQIETLTFGVYDSFIANPAANSPALGTATVNLGFGPAPPAFNPAEGSQASVSLPAPRFIASSGSWNLFSVNSCPTQYALTTAVSPAGAGTITAGGLFDPGTAVSIQAAANPGYQFVGFSGDLSGAATPQTVTMNGPRNVVANFAKLAPNVAASLVSRTGPIGSRQWTIQLLNNGLSAAGSMEISGLTVLQISPPCAQSAPVVVSTTMPVVVGPLAPGASATAPVTLSFPGCSTARYRATISFRDAAGTYTGSTTLNNLYY
jgi:hypothetical protein